MGVQVGADARQRGRAGSRIRAIAGRNDNDCHNAWYGLTTELRVCEWERFRSLYLRTRCFFGDTFKVFGGDSPISALEVCCRPQFGILQFFLVRAAESWSDVGHAINVLNIGF